MNKEKSSRTHLILAFILTILGMVLLLGLSQSNSVAAPPVTKSVEPDLGLGVNEDLIANCRYGAAPINDQFEEQLEVIPRLGAGWFLTFNPYRPSPGPANGADFAYMIKVRQEKDGFVYLPGYEFFPPLGDLAYTLQNNPGELWIIGNEVDRGPNPGETNPIFRGQGDTFPEVYARAYHEAYYFIKSNDPSARVAVSGLVEVTPGRIQYLDTVWNSYLEEYGTPMPVDVWTMHLYILPEVLPDGITPNGIANVALGSDPALGKRSSGGDSQVCSAPDVYCWAEHDSMAVFTEQVVTMRQWMKKHGQKEKPLLLSEYSILYPFEDDGATCFLQDEFGNCFTPARVADFVTNTMRYLNDATDPTLGYSLDDNRLIQQSMWFAIYHTDEGRASNIVEDDLVTFTPIGKAFQDHVFAEEATQNLVADQTDPVIAYAGPDGKAAVTISAAFRNNGNRSISEPVSVTFYKDAALSKPIGSTLITADIRGCAGSAYLASIKWSGLSKGRHKYWFLLDSSEDIDEQPAGNGDNIGSGTVFIMTDSIYLPIVGGE